MTMVKKVSRKTFETKKKIKINKLNKTNEDIKLNIDYESIDVRDVYGYYLINRTTKNNIKRLPDIGSFTNIYPDFFALEQETGLYNKSSKTCLCWFRDDSYFDTIDGLYNAIIYKDIDLLKFYKYRYRNVKMFSNIDYSLYGDFDEETIIHNIKKSIVVYLWLTFECDAIVFPLMTYGDETTLSWCFEHIMENSNVVVSLKGITTGENGVLFKKALKVLVDTRKPKTLIVYSVCCDEKSYSMLEYATSKGINIILVPNTLKSRNLRGVCNG